MVTDASFGSPEAALAGFDQVSDLLMVVEGPDLRIVAVNDALRAWTGGTNLLGLRVSQAFAELVGQPVIDLFTACYRTGEPQDGREWRFQVAVDDGRLEEVYSDFALTPWRDADGVVRGVVARVRDVTEVVQTRHRARAAHRQVSGQLADARALVLTLQEAMLPEGLPLLPGVDVAASYLLADSDTAAGGDWFDVVPTSGGRVALVVGDVVGHGVAASVVMGQLRSVLNAALAVDDDPGAALAHLDGFAVTLPEAQAATVCLAVLDPESGALRYCTAGHPPPLVLSANAAAYLKPSGASPLVTGSDFPVETATLGSGDLLLLYSDGIMERPGRSPAQATGDLVRTAMRAYARRVPDPSRATTARLVCETSIDRLVRPTGHTDDITLLGVQRLSTPRTPLSLALPALPDSVRTVRHDLADWLDQLGVDPVSATSLQHAVCEIVTNSVMHAYRDQTPPEVAIELDALLDHTGVIEVCVTDHGRWRDHQPDEADERKRSFGSRGLAMTRRLVDELHVAHPPESGGGTSVLIRLQPRIATQLVSTPSTQAVRSEPEDDRFALSDDDFAADLEAATSPHRRVRVQGPVDLVAAQALRRFLAEVSRGGTRPVLVDLTAVTLLASAGVQVLAEATDRRLSPGDGAALTLYAPAGAPAQHVLEIVNLPYTTTLN